MKANPQEKKILVVEIVEDEVSLLKLLTDKFKEEGNTVIEAKNGNDGLQLALKEHPDVVVLDLLMPKMDGFEMLEKLREDEWGKTAEVIVLSNLSEDSTRTKRIRNAVSEYLVKADWSLDEIVKKVEEKLKSKE